MKQSGMMLGRRGCGHAGTRHARPRDFMKPPKLRFFSKGCDGAMAAEILGQLQITQHCAASAYSRLLSWEGPSGKAPARARGKGDCARMFVIWKGQNLVLLFVAMARGLAVGREKSAAAVTLPQKVLTGCPAASVTARPLPGSFGELFTAGGLWCPSQSLGDRLDAPLCLLRRGQTGVK